MPNNLYVTLLHYPVENKNGEIIASAVTNLDLHDIARACRVYDVEKFYAVTPLEDQQELVGKIISHWTSGAGSRYNPKRAEALKLLQVKGTWAEVLAEITTERQTAPAVIGTSAKKNQKNIDFTFLRNLLKKQDVCLLFGTAWGLSQDFIEQTDHILEPVGKERDYNHLPVRAAVSIILDRIVENNI